MGQSRQDVLDQKDAVRVKSCWGSMVSWDARFFQTSSFQATESVADATVTKPLRFRAEPDLYYDASECCLIHADLLNTAQRYDIDNTGIYSNPYVRVSYTAWQLPWLRLSRRFERLYAGPHWLITKLAGMPWHNPYRTIKLGDEFENEVWVPNQDLDSGGSWQVNVQKARSSPDAGYLTTAE
ncbi:hypothetical protein MMC13_000191 [Lambiella insularis]|nr:hypothetical protein [Lambiella insularis]